MSHHFDERPFWLDPRLWRIWSPLIWAFIVLGFITLLCWLFLTFQQGEFFIELLKAVCYTGSGFGLDHALKEWKRGRDGKPLIVSLIRTCTRSPSEAHGEIVRAELA
jgi:hypothetical protein